MKRLVTLALGALALAACQGDPTAPAASSAAPSVQRTLSPVAPALNLTSAAAQNVPGRYIVMLKKTTGPNASASATALAAVQRGQVRQVFPSINGFVVDMDDTSAVSMARDPRVLAIAPDVAVQASVSGTQATAPWGLDRIDQASLPLTTTFGYAVDGAGVTVYIVDTGINYTHVDFGGRAVTGYDAVTSGGTAVDCNGHGTHVAGTVGGTKYGVAKGASLIGVRVLDCAGSGTSTGVIAGLDWVLQQKQANPTRPTVVNMSLGGGVSAALDYAVQNLVNAGVTVVVAAGNSTADACTQSPARVPDAITVGATDSMDRFASFSNFGTCVDLDAPGVGITSAYYTSTTAITSMSGTSMASPHVAGAAALYLAANPTATPAQVAAALASNATANKVTGAPAGTPNKLLYVGFLGPVPPANTPPTAAITAPALNATFVKGAAVTFTGTGTDAQSGALTGAALVWTSSVDGQIGTGATFSTTTLSAGTHTITLTAKDPQGATGTATRTITVTVPNTAPTAAISAPAIGASFVQGTAVTFTGTGTDAESGALSGAALVWTSSVNGQIGTGATVTTSALSAGTHTITLTAKDPQGATGTATRSITITVPNAAPTAAITTPTIGASVVEGSPVTFTGAGADAEDGVLAGASLVWTSSIDGQIGTGATFTTSALGDGTHTITLTVKDSQGATATATRTLVVTPKPAATASFSWTCSGMSYAHQCSVDASASTGGGAAVVAYTWSWGNGRSETKSHGVAKNSWSATGTYAVTLTVKDANGLTATVTKQVPVP